MSNNHRHTIAYSLLQGSMWGFYAIVLGFAGNFLYRYGFQDSGISLLLGFSTGAACVLQLAAAEAISRFKKVTTTGVLLLMGCFMVLGAAVMALSTAAVFAVAGLSLTCAVLQAIPAMGNAIAVTAINRGSPTNYDIARGIGSAAYSFFAFITGRLVSRFGTPAIAALALLNGAVFLLSVVWYARLTRDGGDAPAVLPAKPEKSRGFLLSHKPFALFLLGSILLFISHNLVCNFMLQIISFKGGNAAHQGTATAIAAFTELPVMFGFALLLKWKPSSSLVKLSGIFFAVKALALAAAPDHLWVYGAQTLQLLGFALFAIASVHYARGTVEVSETVRAQSYLASTSTIGSLVATSTGGFLCQFLGVQTMILTAAAFAAAGAAVVALGINLGKRSQLLFD